MVATVVWNKVDPAVLFPSEKSITFIPDVSIWEKWGRRSSVSTVFRTQMNVDGKEQMVNLHWYRWKSHLYLSFFLNLLHCNSKTTTENTCRTLLSTYQKIISSMQTYGNFRVPSCENYMSRNEILNDESEAAILDDFDLLELL